MFVFLQGENLKCMETRIILTYPFNEKKMQNVLKRTYVFLISFYLNFSLKSYVLDHSESIVMHIKQNLFIFFYAFPLRVVHLALNIHFVP